MSSDVAITVDHVSKKFCKSIKRSMKYAAIDIARNVFRMDSRPYKLRPSEFWAVDDVSFELKQGESIGLIGPNGSGKTTTLQMINGIFWPDKGKIQVKGKTGALIAVGAGFHPMLTGRENIYVGGAILGMSKHDVDSRFDAIVDFADIGDFLDTPVRFYSSGMFVRLGFAVAAFCDPDILLVDEILAVGDTKFQRKCMEHLTAMKKSGVSFILVSHNMQSVMGVATRGITFDKGKVVYAGDVGGAIATYNHLMVVGGIGSEPNAVVGAEPASLQLVKHYVGYSADDIRILDLRVTNESGEPVQTFSSDEDVSVLITIESSLADDGRLLLSFMDEHDLWVLGTMQQVDIKEGRQRITTTFRPIQLTSGRYKVHLNIFDAMFTVPHVCSNYGYFDVQAKIAVKTPGQHSPLCWVTPEVNVIDL